MPSRFIITIPGYAGLIPLVMPAIAVTFGIDNPGFTTLILETWRLPTCTYLNQLY